MAGQARHDSVTSWLPARRKQPRAWPEAQGGRLAVSRAALPHRPPICPVRPKAISFCSSASHWSRRRNALNAASSWRRVDSSFRQTAPRSDATGSMAAARSYTRSAASARSRVSRSRWLGGVEPGERAHADRDVEFPMGGNHVGCSGQRVFTDRGHHSQHRSARDRHQLPRTRMGRHPEGLTSFPPGSPGRSGASRRASTRRSIGATNPPA